MEMPPTIQIASFGMWDSLVLMVLALVAFGPRRLPEIARKLGKIMYEVRKASNDFKFEMEEELRKVAEADQRQKEAERLLALAPAAQASTTADSQVRESGPGAPSSVLPSQSPVPSPYPGEDAYPEITAGTATEIVPQLPPPTAGEQPPAEEPVSPAAEQALHG
jgi:sec-independent protein translocase protein TatB